MKPFDKRLFILKLRKPCAQMHEETEKRRRKVYYDRKKLGQLGVGYLTGLVDSDIGVLREYLSEVDKACRETWISDGNAVTPEFIRQKLVRHVFTTICSREGAIKGHLEMLVRRSGTGIGACHLTPALHHLVFEIGKLKSELSNRYEIEAIELAKQLKKPRIVSQAPPPPISVGGLGVAGAAPKATQIPPDFPTFFPNELKPKTAVILAEAIRKFPNRTQTLELCRHVISEMTPLFRDAVKAGTMRADLVLSDSAMGGFLHSVLVYNDDGPRSGFASLSDEGYRLEQEAGKSDEWLNLAREIARVAISRRSPNLPVAKPGPHDFTPHIPLSNPLTGHDIGGSATIDIESFTMRVPSRDIGVNSGAITGLSYSTLYFVYFDDPMFVGMTSHRTPNLPVVDDLVNFSLPAGCSHADVIKEIAKQFEWSVKSLSDQLRSKPSPRGKVVFGSARAILDEIAMNYEKLHWTISDGELRFEESDAQMDSNESGTVTYEATTAKENVILIARRFFVGSIRTPAKGGLPTIGNGDGGTFQSSVGPQETMKSPDASTIQVAEVASALEPDVDQNKRKSFVMPILEKKGWSVLEWATHSEVNFHTADNYLKRGVKSYKSTRAKLAKSLGVGVHELPS